MNNSKALATRMLNAVKGYVEKVLEARLPQAVQELPKPKDGKDCDYDIVRSELAKMVSAIPPAKDGKSITVDDVTPLLETAFAKWQVEAERRAADLFQRAIDKMPLPKDGKDGADGFSLEDLTLEFDGERSLTLKFVRGELIREKTIRLIHPIDRGVWKAQQYEHGDTVSWDGSVWIAQRDTKADEKPGASDAFRLAVKRGRDGKSADEGPPKKEIVRLR